jgi:hypothetical protein
MPKPRFYVVSMPHDQGPKHSHWLVCDRKYIEPDQCFKSRTAAYDKAKMMNQEEQRNDLTS